MPPVHLNEFVKAVWNQSPQHDYGEYCIVELVPQGITEAQLQAALQDGSDDLSTPEGCNRALQALRNKGLVYDEIDGLQDLLAVIVQSMLPNSYATSASGYSPYAPPPQSSTAYAAMALGPPAQPHAPSLPPPDFTSPPPASYPAAVRQNELWDLEVENRAFLRFLQNKNLDQNSPFFNPLEIKDEARLRLFLQELFNKRKSIGTQEECISNLKGMGLGNLVDLQKSIITSLPPYPIYRDTLINVADRLMRFIKEVKNAFAQSEQNPRLNPNNGNFDQAFAERTLDDIIEKILHSSPPSARPLPDIAGAPALAAAASSSSTVRTESALTPPRSASTAGPASAAARATPPYILSSQPTKVEISLLCCRGLNEFIGFFSQHSGMPRLKVRGLIVAAITEYSKELYFPLDFSNDRDCQFLCDTLKEKRILVDERQLALFLVSGQETKNRLNGLLTSTMEKDIAIIAFFELLQNNSPSQNHPFFHNQKVTQTIYMEMAVEIAGTLDLLTVEGCNEFLIRLQNRGYVTQTQEGGSEKTARMMRDDATQLANFVNLARAIAQNEAPISSGDQFKGIINRVRQQIMASPYVVYEPTASAPLALYGSK